jgi:hypothetical protein
MDLSLAPSEHRLLTGEARFQLAYKQRSGRPELIVASSLLGGFVGAGAVAAAINKNLDGQNVQSVLLSAGGFISGAAIGGLLATQFAPRYIPDNRALFVIGAMWIGAAEGFGFGVVGRQIATLEQAPESPCGPNPCRGPIGEQLQIGFAGSIAGLGLGLTSGALFAKHAPTYGRVTLIQSAALGGAVTGALAQVGLRWKPYGTDWRYSVRQPTSGTDAATGSIYSMGVKGTCQSTSPLCAFSDQQNTFLDLTPGMLIGLNVGLAAGLLGAYLPDQSHYGPSWKRVLFIDVAAGAGAIAGGVFGCVFNVSGCLQASQQSETAHAVTAWSALAGGIFGAVGGIFLTAHSDEGSSSGPQSPSPEPPSTLPIATFVPMRGPNGEMIPAFAAIGSF